MVRSLSLVPLAQLSLLAGQEHGRTIPLSDITPFRNLQMFAPDLPRSNNIAR
jgi:hypothetical protein